MLKVIMRTALKSRHTLYEDSNETPATVRMIKS